MNLNIYTFEWANLNSILVFGLLSLIFPPHFPQFRSRPLDAHSTPLFFYKNFAHYLRGLLWKSLENRAAINTISHFSLICMRMKNSHHERTRDWIRFYAVSKSFCSTRPKSKTSNRQLHIPHWAWPRKKKETKSYIRAKWSFRVRKSFTICREIRLQVVALEITQFGNERDPTLHQIGLWAFSITIHITHVIFAQWKTLYFTFFTISGLIRR